MHDSSAEICPQQADERMTDARLISRLREMTYADALSYMVEEFPINEALVFKGQRWTFRDVKRLVDRASGRLATLAYLWAAASPSGCPIAPSISGTCSARRRWDWFP